MVRDLGDHLDVGAGPREDLFVDAAPVGRSQVKQPLDRGGLPLAIFKIEYDTQGEIPKFTADITMRPQCASPHCKARLPDIVTARGELARRQRNRPAGSCVSRIYSRLTTCD